jgi:signal transduction histidine kinase
VRGGKTVGLRAIAVDITDRKSIEEELEKLATGIAHQVRNPVMTIGGFALRLQKRLAPDDTPQDWLKIILAEVRRLERMVSDIHRHTGLARAELRRTALKAVLETVLSECRPAFDSQGIRIKFQFSRETPEVIADANLLELALVNIIANAREAMPDGGEVELAVFRDGDQVCISIKDVGVGIAPEDLPNVFDPFFSSKPLSSGLGLTTAQRIISEHKGQIKIRSVPGKGTEVRIWLNPARPRTVKSTAEFS